MVEETRMFQGMAAMILSPIGKVGHVSHHKAYTDKVLQTFQQQHAVALDTTMNPGARLMKESTVQAHVAIMRALYNHD